MGDPALGDTGLLSSAEQVVMIIGAPDSGKTTLRSRRDEWADAGVARQPQCWRRLVLLGLRGGFGAGGGARRERRRRLRRTDRDSVVSFDNLAAVPKSVLTLRLGELDGAGRLRMCDALRAMANC